MCCIGTILATCMSHMLYFSEKFLYCFTCAALVSCLVTTIFLTLGMGIGIGYNYCFVDFKTKHRYVPARYSKYNPTPHWKRSAATYVTVSEMINSNNDLRTAESSNQVSTGNVNETNSQDNTYNIEQSHNNINYETTEHMQENNNEVTTTSKQTIVGKTPDESPNLIIPISGLDLIALLSKFRSENRNYSLQIVTT